MKEFLKDGLESLAYFIYAIPLFLMLKGEKSKGKEVLFIYYVASVFFILIACYTTDVNLNRIIYNAFFFFTICILSYYFIQILLGKTRKNIVRTLFLIHLVVFTIISFKSQQLLAINKHFYAFTYLTIVLYALIYFEQVLTNITELNILHQFDFWLVSGYLLYYLSCFFIILFYANVDEKLRSTLWSLQNFILFMSSVLTLSGALWIKYKKKSY